MCVCVPKFVTVLYLALNISLSRHAGGYVWRGLPQFGIGASPLMPTR